VTGSREKYNRLPERRADRRIIMVLDQTKLDALDYEPDSSELLHQPGVAIVSSRPDLAQVDDLTQSLENLDQLVPGAILVASPYRDGEYAEIEEASDQFGLKKWSELSLLCGLLGARTLEIEVVEQEQNGQRTEFKAGGGRGPIQAGGDLTWEQRNSLVGQLSWKDEFRAQDLLDFVQLGPFLDVCVSVTITPLGI
jgi:hypothetical protein